MIAMQACIAAPRYFMRRNLVMRHGNAQSWPRCCSDNRYIGPTELRALALTLGQ
jgi:hypothetical protein